MDNKYFKTLLNDIRTKCMEGYEWDNNDKQFFVDTAEKYQAMRKHQAELRQEENKLKKQKSPLAQAKHDECEAAKAAYIASEVGIAESMKPILQRLGDTLHKDDELVQNLMKCAILQQATSKYLAEFVAEDPTIHGALINEFLEDTELQKQMLLHGGPQKGRWGHAVKLYRHELLPLVEVGSKFETVHTKFAMAMALEHAAPVGPLFDEKGVFADPVHRFKAYIQAHKEGKLDPAFEHFNIWEMRHIGNSDARDEQLEWARDYLARYNPHQAAQTVYSWRYAAAVRSDVGYRAPVWPGGTRTYQQMVSGGGKCGPRAQYGRFMVKAWGLPTWGVKQPAHAAVGRWTPQGWIVILGADWPFSNWDGRKGRDFKPEAHARAYCYKGEELYFRTVTLLECMAEVHEENYKNCMNNDFLTPKFPWFSLTRIQREIYSAMTQPGHFERKGENIVETKIEQYLQRTDKPEDDKEIVVEADGKIVMPANAYMKDLGATRVLSFDQGAQVNVGKRFNLVYRLPKEGMVAGEYEFSIELVNVHLKQGTFFCNVWVPGEEKAECRIEVPYTVGEWQWTTPVKVKLAPNARIQFGRNGDFWNTAVKRVSFTPC